jgi:Protein of unknown function (DUF3311)
VSEQTSPSPSPQHRPPAVLVAVAVLVAAPVVALMWVSSYARETPMLWGIPFFYWYQFLWVFLAAGCTGLAYWIVTATSPRRAARPDRGGRS